MYGFKIAFGLLFVGGIVIYVIKRVLPSFITGTSASENIFTYILPAATFVTIIALIIQYLFGIKKRKQ